MRKRLRKKLDKMNFSNGFSLSKIVIEAQLKSEKERKEKMEWFHNTLFNEFLKKDGIQINPEKVFNIVQME